MSSNNLREKSVFHFFRTIRFKLTLLYSLITFLFSAILVVSLNLYLNSYLTADPGSFRPPSIVQSYPNGNQVIISFNDLVREERERIREIRLEDLRQIQNLSLISLFPIAIISFILGYILSGRFLNPIAELSNQFQYLQTKDLGKTIPVEVEDEVGELIMSFNELSTRLNNSFTSQEQFVQDASHELKTPLTVIQTNLDTIVDDETASKQELQSAIALALKGMKDLRRLTENLLQLSGSENITFDKVDLNKLIVTRIDALKPYADTNRVIIKSELPNAPLNIAGDEFAIGSAVSNIIENAIKYSHHGKNPEVKVGLKKVNENAEITIADNGPGIPKEFQSKIFDRFYRIDKSRNHNNGGFGLGLAIAAKHIKTHQGDIKISSKAGETIFTIVLPIKHQ